jgi:hypothetical protein
LVTLWRDPSSAQKIQPFSQTDHLIRLGGKAFFTREVLPSMGNKVKLDYFAHTESFPPVPQGLICLFSFFFSCFFPGFFPCTRYLLCPPMLPPSASTATGFCLTSASYHRHDNVAKSLYSWQPQPSELERKLFLQRNRTIRYFLTFSLANPLLALYTIVNCSSSVR